MKEEIILKSLQYLFKAPCIRGYKGLFYRNGVISISVMISTIVEKISKIKDTISKISTFFMCKPFNNLSCMENQQDVECIYQAYSSALFVLCPSGIKRVRWRSSVDRSLSEPTISSASSIEVYRMLSTASFALSPHWFKCY